MKINICEQQYTIESKVDNLLSILFSIKSEQNSSLAFRSGCRSGVCGSCAVVVNGIEKLACKTTIISSDTKQDMKIHLGRIITFSAIKQDILIQLVLIICL